MSSQATVLVPAIGQELGVIKVTDWQKDNLHASYSIDDSLQLCAIHHVQMEVHAQMLGNVHAFLIGREITVNKVSLLYIAVIIFQLIVSQQFSTKLIIAVCTPSCANGGTCVTPGHCLCTSSWSGQYCQEGKYHKLTAQYGHDFFLLKLYALLSVPMEEFALVMELAAVKQAGKEVVVNKVKIN